MKKIYLAILLLTIFSVNLFSTFYSTEQILNKILVRDSTMVGKFFSSDQVFNLVYDSENNALRVYLDSLLITTLAPFTEAELETILSDVTDVYTNNDGDWNATEWDSAYAWGDHSLQNYLDKDTDTYVETESDPTALLTAGTDNVKDTHIDWGAGAGQVSADDVPDGSTYAIPTLTQESNWDSAYGWGDHSGEGYLKNISEDTSPQIMLSNPGTDLTSQGEFVTMSNGNGGAVAYGDFCYIASDGDMEFAVSDTSGTKVEGIYMADQTIAAAASGRWLSKGLARNDAWSWTPGQKIYISITGTTGNTITSTPPSGGNYLFLVAIAKTPTIIDVDPVRVPIKTKVE